ncbi:coproporphyrinogen III oxidase, aerobic [Synechococcus sp. PCC 7335]|uniref:oxygen-dependent coproporphyrinogen oxidase n=1 Tax=Synechococcus sp. (strain ATCC 29403 / PCC 7335) TaxID=91464 RepID=UPI00017ED980|nr:oxygen-dependent coproporphyrinogen oxidase [Synechococcus sp. PCC 7335]EDX84016.1 coproporphyrinogen III oxidase, aerobic [Synechococcus sp. PCC 7335]
MTLSSAKAARPSSPSPEASAPILPPDGSRDRVSTALKGLQDRICQKLEALDGGGKFQEDAWDRPEGGGGRSRVMKAGNVFEQGGVGFSEVWGDSLPPAILVKRPEAEGHQFYATGTSMVLHPRNPYVPTVHLNYRYFEAGPVWWFGGGIDLTPYYANQEDVVHFHKTLKAACDQHNPQYYPTFKRWCDEYFYLKHRNEPRGVGGIFFDYQNGQRGELYRGHNQDGPAALYSQKTGSAPKRSWEELFQFAMGCGDAFLPAYVPIVEKRADTAYGDRERNFQLYRRGRYVEFNLVYDRGTLFGLQTNGRTESILMSLPPLVRWEYSYMPEPGTPESELYDIFLKPHNWAEMNA